MKYKVEDGFPYYIEVLGDKDYKQLFRSDSVFVFLETISENKADHRYRLDKWSIKQIIGHITDHERIMTYRALRFSRKDTTTLPGYDQNLFIENSIYDQIGFRDMVSDLRNVRNATNSFIAMLSDEQLQLKGLAWKYELTVEDFLKATIGHQLHHIQVIKERYL